jgi:hypothetical protein
MYQGLLVAVAHSDTTGRAQSLTSGRSSPCSRVRAWCLALVSAICWRSQAAELPIWPARISGQLPRTTTTGQDALVTQWMLTEPTSMPVNAPCPRCPTTSRLALADSSISTCAG